MAAATLFITYDGLLDPLGRSQILPYLRGIAAHPRSIHIISFEKRERYISGGAQLKKELYASGIKWTPLPFGARGRILAKAWDLLRMYVSAAHLHFRFGFPIIHCRSYQAMHVGSFLKKLRRTKLIFDMRGFWVDDRLDGGRWRSDGMVHRILLRLLKGLERKMLESADTVVVLTNAAALEIPRLAPRSRASLATIPCCADYSHFQLVSNDDRLQTKNDLGLLPGSRVISYLGSLGGLYQLDCMLALFGAAASEDPQVSMLLITHDWGDQHEKLVAQLGLAHLRSRIVARGATREEVPRLLAVSDVMLCFYQPGFSRKGTSPTKFAEALAVGVPVICNVGVGDVEYLVEKLDAGLVIDLASPASINEAARALPLVYAKGGPALRERSRELLGLEVAEGSYRRVYHALEGST